MTVTENKTLIAIYDTANVTDVLYTYTFYGEDGVTVLLQASAPYGTVITPPTDPTKAADSLWEYTFAGWQGYTAGMTLTGDSTFTASFTKRSVVTAAPPAASTSGLAPAPDGSTPAPDGGTPATSAPTGAASAAPLLSGPVIWVALGVLAVAVLTPTVLIATEREQKKKPTERDTRDSW